MACVRVNVCVCVWGGGGGLLKQLQFLHYLSP
jgi:hypothetical protein